MTGTDLCVNKSQFVPVIFEPPCSIVSILYSLCCDSNIVVERLHLQYPMASTQQSSHSFWKRHLVQNILLTLCDSKQWSLSNMLNLR